MRAAVSPATPDQTEALDALDRRIINTLQRGFPLSPRPYAQAAQVLDTDETTLIERLRGLLARGLLTRFGPLFQIERAGGRFVLCACHADAARLDAVIAAINAHPEVAHHYERTHRLNLWFVLALEHASALPATLARIEADAGVQVLAFPKEREFYVNLYLPVEPTVGWVERSETQHLKTACEKNLLGFAHAHPNLPADPAPDTNVDPALDRALIQATQAGLPLLPAPYQALAEQLHTTEQRVIAHFAAMHTRGLLRRIAAVPHHVRLGWRANAMTVWDVEDAQADALGERIGALPFVSHCYRRPRRQTEWPYNLFAMIHARTREDAAPLIAQIAQTLGPACRAHDVLWSTRVLKKTGLRI